MPREHEGSAFLRRGKEVEGNSNTAWWKTYTKGPSNYLSLGTLFSHHLKPSRLLQNHALIPISAFSALGIAVTEDSGIHASRHKLGVSKGITGRKKGDTEGKRAKPDLKKKWDKWLRLRQYLSDVLLICRLHFN